MTAHPTAARAWPTATAGFSPTPSLPSADHPFESPPPNGADASVRLAHQAYGVAAPIRTARQAEQQVLSTVTARLSAAQGRPLDHAGRAQALHDNRRLWTRLASEVADSGNGLPQDLRARLFWLAEFTSHHSRRVLKGEADLLPLIEVNAAVMRGLGAKAAVAVSVAAAAR